MFHPVLATHSCFAQMFLNFISDVKSRVSEARLLQALKENFECERYFQKFLRRKLKFRCSLGFSKESFWASYCPGLSDITLLHSVHSFTLCYMTLKMLNTDYSETNIFNKTNTLKSRRRFNYFSIACPKLSLLMAKQETGFTVYRSI